MPPRRSPSFSTNTNGSSQNECSSQQTAGSSNEEPKTRRVRGKTKGEYLSKILGGVKKVKVTFPRGGLKPVGDWSAQWGTELGVICRNNAKVTCKKWKHISQEDKDAIYAQITGKFYMDMNSWNVRAGTNNFLQNRFRSYRHELHKHYKKHCPLEQAIKHPPKGVSLEDWKVCCEQFADETFQDKSRKNTLNRMKQKMTHCTGSKSFIRLRYEKADPITQAPLDRIETYKATHYIEGKDGNLGTWTQPEAEANYGQMIELIGREKYDGTVLTSDEIGDMVLGTTSGYVRGLGYGEPSRPSSIHSYRNEAALEDARKRAEDAEKRAQELELRIDNQNAEIQTQNKVIESQNLEIQSHKERMDEMVAEQSSMRVLMETLLQKVGSISQ